jgi:8-oxo-dGTP pyrophosphatase MutT (NUDIX family)
LDGQTISKKQKVVPKPDPAKLRRTAAAAAVFDSEGRILLHRRSDNGNWALPGGTMETGETAVECIEREVKEETGYDVKVIRLIGIYSEPKNTTMSYPDGNTVAYVCLLFECRVTGGAPALSDESLAVDWFPPDTLPQPFHASHVPRVEDAAARQVAAFYR